MDIHFFGVIVGPTALPQARSRCAILSFPTGMPMDCLTLLLLPVAVRGGGDGRQECGVHQESQKGLAGRGPPGAVGSEWGRVGTMHVSGVVHPARSRPFLHREATWQRADEHRLWRQLPCSNPDFSIFKLHELE